MPKKGICLGGVDAKFQSEEFYSGICGDGYEGPICNECSENYGRLIKILAPGALILGTMLGQSWKLRYLFLVKFIRCIFPKIKNKFWIFFFT